jgi:diacylglycerol kinase (ATP)
MRAAAVFGPGSSEKDLRPFRKICCVAEWITGLPGSRSEADVVLILGGDGTVHRHLGRLVELQIPLLVVPRGSGNDFARALNLDRQREALKAWRDFSRGGGNVQSIDLGMITPVSGTHDPSATQPVGRYFCCVAGVGLDSEAARRGNRLPRWLRRHGGYALSALGALLQFTTFSAKIFTAGNHQEWILRNEGPVILVSFANATSYGSGMKIAPRAQLTDGKIDICLITEMDKLKLFCLFPTVYFGRHLDLPEVEYFQSERLRVETEKPLEMYADGEYVCQTPVEIEVKAAVLRVIVP